MTKRELEAAIQEKLRASQFNAVSVVGTGVSQYSTTNGYVTNCRTTLIVSVPETHDMAKLVAETRATMKLEEPAPIYTTANVAAWGHWTVPAAQPDLIIEKSRHRVELETKIINADVSHEAKSATVVKPISASALPVPDRAPGAKLHTLARFLLTAEAYRRYVEPHLADIHLEYNNALRDGDIKGANRVVWRGYLEVIKPFAYGLVRSLFRLWLQTRR
jgi:hypothetical protein